MLYIHFILYASAKERMLQAVSLVLITFSIENSHIFEQQLDASGDERMIFGMGFIVDLLHAPAFQLFHKLIHVPIQPFDFKHILKGKGTTLFHHTKCFLHQRTLVADCSDLVEHKVADCCIKIIIFIAEAGVVSIDKLNIIYIFNMCVLFTLFLGIIPSNTPVVKTNSLQIQG